MARKKTASTMVAAALRKVCDALEQVFTKFSMDTFKGLRVKLSAANGLDAYEWGWMSDRRLMPHLEHLVKNAYAVGQLQAPAPQVRVTARKQQADDIQRPEAESYFVRNLGRLAWQASWRRHGAGELSFPLYYLLQNTFGTAAQLRATREELMRSFEVNMHVVAACFQHHQSSFWVRVQEGKQAAKRAGARSMAADLLDGNLSDAEDLEEDVVDVGGRNGQVCHRAGNVWSWHIGHCCIADRWYPCTGTSAAAVDQQQLQCAFERFRHVRSEGCTSGGWCEAEPDGVGCSTHTQDCRVIMGAADIAAVPAPNPQLCNPMQGPKDYISLHL
ncbi:hypothetical protein VOLCADRAFT_108055 [Volvox carteri f. nagariensis]|uniref:Uncharacterized protein n=1 Tax=Volvox carteri f. nagariensis TaxID=3068 RepID=D8UHZ7_VOLCA|nr:uncharacterized protein VOLCADRAFT_108055 [Volvox carteri f. nagariensis]EFJ40648.1 hypothetical protein VOLCADRAFT_108055 [Volvox carteri f. nagariensis]|eukprot:XP_002958274.1 hypothetical protein VOLCADRAFT_108055 [Volvox carteri f. nagariensis]